VNYRYFLEVLTPVHIFSHHPEPWEVVADGDRLLVLEEAKLARLLVGRGLRRQWCREVTSRGSIQRFLATHGMWAEVESCTKRTIVCPQGAQEAPRRIALTMSTGAPEEVYVPGSTVKGSIRTALLFRLLKDNPDLASRVRESAEQKMQQAGSRRQRRQLAKTIGKETDQLLQHAALPGARSEGPHTDWMRLLRVGDASPQRAGQHTQAYQVGVLSLRGDGRRATGYRTRTTFWVEAIRPGTVLEGRLIFDEDLLRWFEPRRGLRPLRSVEDVLVALQLFSAEVLEAQCRWYRQIGLADIAGQLERLRGRANIRLGRGGGWDGRTVGLVFPEQFRRQIRDTFYRQRGPAPFSKSRQVLLRNNRPSTVLGWARLSLER